MKRLTIIMILVFILALGVGCSKKAPMHPGETTPEPQNNMPKIGQVNPGEMEEPAAEPEVPDEPEAESEQDTIGNRVGGTEPETEPVAETEPEQTGPEAEDVVDIQSPSDDEGMTIRLTAAKRMDPGEDLTIPKGTEITFVNEDTWPHQITVNSGSGFDTIRHWPGERMEAGEESSYVFNDPGVYNVRDIFSGDMRIIVTVE